MNMIKAMQRYFAPLLILVFAGLAVLGFTLASMEAPHQSFGAANTNQLIGGFPYFLAGSGISSSATSITLTSLTLPQSGYKITTTDLSTPFYLTIEAGNTTRQEFVSCTTVLQNANNTATLSGCTRGLLPLSPYTASTTYAFSHSGGTTAIFSNPPQVYNQFYALGNVSTSTNTLIFSSTTPPHYDIDLSATQWSAATTSTLVSLAKLNLTAIAGAANASTILQGLLQVGTAAQQASSTALGTTGALLGLITSNATDTPLSKCNSAGSAAGAGCTPIALLNGKLSQAWLDLTAAWTFVGNVITSGTFTANSTATFNGATAFNGSTTGLDWQLVVSTTTAVNTALLQATTTKTYTKYLVIINTYGFASADPLRLFFNNDAGSNYGGRSFTNYAIAANSAGSSNSGVLMDVVSSAGTTSPISVVMNIYNATSTRKQIIWQGTSNSSAAIIPDLMSGDSVWNNTTAQITNFELVGGSGQSLLASSTMTIYGSNSGN